jgi:glycerate 2-kinase
MANIHNQVQSTTAAPEVVLRKMFDAAVASAQPLINIKQHLPSPPIGRTIIIGAGKASAAMAHALEQHWQGPISGVVVTRYGYAVACQHITILEASHPVPDMAGQQAATDILATVSDLTADDLVICLISGGGSSLMSLPAEGIRFAAKILSLMISDVPGDDMSSIASGPTVADNSTFADAINIVRRYDMQLPDSVMAYLQQAQNETPNQDDNRLSTTKNIIIAAPQMSLEAAAEVAIEHGFTPLILGDSIEGESRDVALVHAGIAQQVVRHAQPIKPPCILLSGGETTVTLKGNGRGGRNAEFALSLAVALKSEPNIWGIACDTDGIDGSEDNAGAVITPTTLNRAFAAGCKAIDYLDNNDGYSFFETIGDLVMTGPTMTNVNDFRAILITDQNVK